MQPRTTSSRRRRDGRSVARGALAAVVAVVGAALLVALYVLVLWLRLPDVSALGTDGDPNAHAATAFMRQDGCAKHQRTWRPLSSPTSSPMSSPLSSPMSSIDPRLACAVVWAEDSGLFHHDGVDWDALEDAARDAVDEGAVRRGGSTIPMQLARNLYFSRARTPSRKLREVLVAPRLVARLGRMRTLELYLNTVEWAPCTYGAEAAAHHYLGHGADVIDAAEAVFLASMLPRPSVPPGRDARDKSRLFSKQQAVITRLRRAGLVSNAGSRGARAELAAVWRQIGAHRARADAPASGQWYASGCGTLPRGTQTPGTTPAQGDVPDPPREPSRTPK